MKYDNDPFIPAAHLNIFTDHQLATILVRSMLQEFSSFLETNRIKQVNFFLVINFYLSDYVVNLSGKKNNKITSQYD